MGYNNNIIIGTKGGQNLWVQGVLELISMSTKGVKLIIIGTKGGQNPSLWVRKRSIFVIMDTEGVKTCHFGYKKG